MTLYVANIGYHTTEASLKDIFSQYGEVSSAKIILDRQTGKSRGFGFVEMGSDDEATKAIQGLNNKEIDGRALSVSVAKEKTERPNFKKW
jgi:RNA recognition motif-containing protein